MNRFKIPLILGTAAIAIVAMVASSVSNNDLYMSTLDEWDSQRAQRERVRVTGFIQEGSIHEREDALETSFVIRNEEGTLSQPAHYSGVLPDLFRDNAQVVAAGRLDEGGVFVTDELMTKCPSKYEGAEEAPHETGPESAEPAEALESARGGPAAGNAAGL